MWIEPKTNWVSTDAITSDDYNRIAGNLYFLKDYIERLFGDVGLIAMQTDKDYASRIYAREMNAVESNLDALNNASYDLDIGTAETYVSNGNTPLYVELNRIESATKKMYLWLSINSQMRPHLAFGLGKGKWTGIKRTTL